MAATDSLLVPTVIVGGIALILLAAGLRETLRAVRLWRARPVPISELDRASGTVTVAGRAESVDETLRAPLSGRDCLAYVWRISGVRTTGGFDGRIERSFHQLGREQRAVRFRLADYSGSVVVDPAGASLRLAEERIDDPVSDPIEERGGGLRDIDRLVLDEGPREYYEARVDEGETVVVQGRVRPVEDPTIDVERLGVQLSGGGLFVADTSRKAAITRTRNAAALSLALGLAALVVLIVILTL